MKKCKQILLSITALCMISLISVEILAEESRMQQQAQLANAALKEEEPQLRNNMQLEDQANLLSERENTEINRMLEELEQLTGWDMMALTTNDTGRMDSTAYAETWFDEYNTREDGVICAIDMDNREIVVRAFGESRFYITDKRKDKILDAGYEKVSEEAYGDTLLAMLGEVKTAYEEEKPEKNYLYDEESGKITDYSASRSSSGNIVKRREITLWEMLISLGLAVAAGGGAIGIILGKYRLKLGGYKYPIEQNGRISLEQKEDRLVDSFVTARRIPRETHHSSGGSRSSGGRSTVHRGAGGRSSSGGSRKF